jgi:single-strand selective monofunctional uracil DNA glycosylase
MSLPAISRDLVRELRALRFRAPVHTVYSPLEYAAEPHARYLERYGRGRKQVLFVGMNPGPWGMAQTGVPFGEVGMVREWLAITGRVEQPERLHPKRPVQGFACTRSEVSGRRFWGFLRERFGSAERFFARGFVHNYCPLLFFARTGTNLTPDKLAVADRAPLQAACDKALRRTAQTLGVGLVVGIGAFAEARARAATQGLELRIGRILHPSPASPAANRGWAEAVERELSGLGVLA